MSRNTRRPRLYHNNHDGTFTDVTHKAGLDVELFGMGVAVGDYDNDGFDDLFRHRLRAEPPFSQQRQRHVTDVTQKRACWAQEFSTSAAWVGLDKAAI